jgi:glycosyltransferase involved in cell wall biosynthesis
MRLLKAHDPSCELFFFKAYPGSAVDTNTCIRTNTGGVEVAEYNVYEKDINNLWRLRGCYLSRKRKYADLAASLSPTVVQASDARELALAYMICQRTGARLVYDSHEDYFNQVYEYNNKSARALVAASFLHWEELRFVRRCDAVFCTDEFLIQRYTKGVYRASNVTLLRNFPLEAVASADEREFRDTDQLRLVYIGGVDRWRGVLQCAEYCGRFNREHPRQRLTFTIYGPEHPLLHDLTACDWVEHIAWINYPDLMTILPKYDVGVCLWQPLRKFHRNLPIKNFDYMACGLPVITSNFGNLKRHIEDTGAGYAIDPCSYDCFAEAIKAMFNPHTREAFSRAGVRWVRTEGNFVKEGASYVTTMLG